MIRDGKDAYQKKRSIQDMEKKDAVMAEISIGMEKKDAVMTEKTDKYNIYDYFYHNYYYHEAEHAII
eukprot:6450562-Heterocapsa_arctica.AAC.1